MSKPVYPLQQLYEIKLKRLDAARKVLKDKEFALEEEKKKKKKLEDERDEAKQHHVEKLMQIRQALDEGLPSNKIQQMKQYLKIAQEEVVVRQRKVDEQQKKVDQAQVAVDEARKEVRKRETDIEKLDLHKVEWNKEIKVLEEHAETILNDDMGTIIHTSKKRKKPST